MIPEFTDKDAKNTATIWHGGQATTLYSLASTGSIIRGVANEIDGCMNQANEYGEIEAAEKLALLKKYVMSRQDKNPVNGWANL